ATPLKPKGTVALPKELSPQATTVPSALSARLWPLPAAIAMTLVTLTGTFVCVPQAMTVPSGCRASAWVHPAAIAMALVIGEEGLAEGSPQTTTEEFVRNAMLYETPAPMAVTPFRPNGGVA